MERGVFSLEMCGVYSIHGGLERGCPWFPCSCEVPGPQAELGRSSGVMSFVTSHAQHMVGLCDSEPPA